MQPQGHTTSPSTPHAGKSVLILDQGLLKDRRGKPIHGVELFRLYLVRQMLERGVRVTVCAARSWESAFDDYLPMEHPNLRAVFVPNVLGVALNGITAAVSTVGDEYDAVLMGNPRKGLVPAMYTACFGHESARRLVFAHRRGEHRFLDMVQALSFDTLCVSEEVARKYRGNTPGRVDVMYGLPNHAAFHPPEPAEDTPRADDGLCHFALIARLPSVSKGDAKAVEAFTMLPAEVRERCRLHLVSFIDEPPPRVANVPGVVCHPWLPAGEIPGLLRQMDVLLALSTNETFSQAIVQGMLTALPVIATRIPVYTEKMDTGGGILADEPEKIARAMERLASDPAERARMGRIARETALQRYCWSTDDFLDRHLFPARGASAGVPGK